MLVQNEVERLLSIEKFLTDESAIQFPGLGDSAKLEAKSVDQRDFFLFDVNRPGTIKLSKCTYQERYAVVEILLRLDVGGPTHENPDGTEIPCPHLHVYKEGYGDKWAYPLPSDFADPTDLVKTLREFLRYCKVQNIPSIQMSIN